MLFLILCVITSGCGVLKKEKLSGLQISTQGSTASVYINGEYKQKTPFINQELKPGKYSVRLEPEVGGLTPYETTITLYPDTLAVMEWEFGSTPETSGGVIFEMEPLKKKGSSALSIVSIPDGTIVKVDDTSQGFTPVIMSSITAGSHRLQVTLPSYRAQEKTINIIEGFQMNVTVKLSKDKMPKSASQSQTEQASESAQVASISATTQLTPSPTFSVQKPYVKILSTGTGWLRVRDQSSASGQELAKVDTGKSYPFLKSENGWYLIEYEDGLEGWISGQYAERIEQ